MRVLASSLGIAALLSFPVTAFAQRGGDASATLSALGGSGNLSIMSCNSKVRSDAVSGVDPAQAARTLAACEANAKKNIQVILDSARRQLSKKPKAQAVLKEWYGDWLAAFNQMPTTVPMEQVITDRLDRILARATAEAE